MMNFLRPTFLTFILLACLFGNAQRVPNYGGCHRHHNSGPRLKSLTSMEKVLLNESIARSDTFDILSYLINIDVTNYLGHEIKAATTLLIHPLMADQEYIRLDLHQLQVDSVKSGSDNLAFDYDGEILKVNFAAVPATDDTTQFTVYYQGFPYKDPIWGGFYFDSNYIYNLGIGLTTIPPNFGRVWYPCFDSFVERATYEYHVKSAGTFRAHCQGTFLGETALAGDTVIRSFAFNQPIPTHLSAIAVADYSDYDYVHTGANGAIDVRLTAKPAQLAAMQNVFQDLGSAIDACEYWFGPYAWERVGYILTTDGALEIPTNIAYPQYMTGEAIASNDGLMSHELGHHWWGDMVTPHNHNDMWMKEGPAEYSSHLMVEWMDGEGAFIKAVKDNQLIVLENAHIDDEGFWPMSPMPDPWIYGTHTYQKGASVMHNMRGYLGDELFRQAMTNIQAEHAYTDMTPEQFSAAIEEETGYDMEPFFNDQIFSPGFSTFVVDSFPTEPAGSNYAVQVFIQQKLRQCPNFYTHVPMDVTLIGANNERAEFQAVGTGQFTDFTLTSPFAPAMVVLNGYNRLNQARMDNEFMTYADNGFNPAVPYVDFRVNKENVVDSSLMRIEHIWAAPDAAPLGPGIYDISNVHYWIVSGLWNEGDYFKGRLTYRGSDPSELDYDLYHDGEENAVLLYRPSSYEPWQVYEDFTMGTGSLTNGDGYFVVDTLRRGQYAFANGDPSLMIAENNAGVENGLLLYPVPASGSFRVKGKYKGHEIAFYDIFSVEGRMLQRTSGVVDGNFEKEIDTASLEAGIYVLNIRTIKGELLGTERFEIVK